MEVKGKLKRRSLYDETRRQMIWSSDPLVVGINDPSLRSADERDNFEINSDADGKSKKKGKPGKLSAGSKRKIETARAPTPSPPKSSLSSQSSSFSSQKRRKIFTKQRTNDKGYLVIEEEVDDDEQPAPPRALHDRQEQTRSPSNSPDDFDPELVDFESRTPHTPQPHSGPWRRLRRTAAPTIDGDTSHTAAEGASPRSPARHSQHAIHQTRKTQVTHNDNDDDDGGDDGAAAVSDDAQSASGRRGARRSNPCRRGLTNCSVAGCRNTQDRDLCVRHTQEITERTRLSRYPNRDKYLIENIWDEPPIINLNDSKAWNEHVKLPFLSKSFRKFYTLPNLDAIAKVEVVEIAEGDPAWDEHAPASDVPKQYGVRARKRIKCNEVIGEYVGKVCMEKSRWGARHLSPRYKMCYKMEMTLPDKLTEQIRAQIPDFLYYIINAEGAGNEMKYINSVLKNNSHEQNAAWYCQFLRDQPRVVIYAIREISEGETILLNYGEEFFDEDSQEPAFPSYPFVLRARAVPALCWHRAGTHTHDHAESGTDGHDEDEEGKGHMEEDEEDVMEENVQEDGEEEEEEEEGQEDRDGKEEDKGAEGKQEIEQEMEAEGMVDEDEAISSSGQGARPIHDPSFATTPRTDAARDANLEVPQQVQPCTALVLAASAPPWFGLSASDAATVRLCCDASVWPAKQALTLQEAVLLFPNRARGKPLALALATALEYQIRTGASLHQRAPNRGHVDFSLEALMLSSDMCDYILNPTHDKLQSLHNRVKQTVDDDCYGQLMVMIMLLSSFHAK